MNKRTATWRLMHARDCLRVRFSRWRLPRTALIASMLLAGTACSSPNASTDSAPSEAADARPAGNVVTACQPRQLALRLDAGDGAFNGMSHAGTMLVLRNTGTTRCAVPARPIPTFTDANKQILDIRPRESSGAPLPPTAPLTLAPGAAVTSTMRWVSGNVYDNGHCESPSHVALKIGNQDLSTAFEGRLCGEDGKPVLYELTAFHPATTPAPATAPHSTAYACDDGLAVQAAYPDSDTAVLVFDGNTHQLHVAVSADGARYVDGHWQWWTRGMHQAQLAPLKSGETIASAAGVPCTAP